MLVFSCIILSNCRYCVRLIHYYLILISLQVFDCGEPPSLLVLLFCLCFSEEVMCFALFETSLLLQSEQKQISVETYLSSTHITHWNASAAFIILSMDIKLRSNLPHCSLVIAIHHIAETQNTQLKLREVIH